MAGQLTLSLSHTLFHNASQEQGHNSCILKVKRKSLFRALCFHLPYKESQVRDSSIQRRRHSLSTRRTLCRQSISNTFSDSTCIRTGRGLCSELLEVRTAVDELKVVSKVRHTFIALIDTPKVVVS